MGDCERKLLDIFFKTVIPIKFTVIKGHKVLINDKLYTKKAIWDNLYLSHPEDFRKRFKASISKAIKEFLADITPHTKEHRIRIDYSAKSQRAILDLARNGKIMEGKL